MKEKLSLKEQVIIIQRILGDFPTEKEDNKDQKNNDEK
jgi:hypothetical protein